MSKRELVFISLWKPTLSKLNGRKYSLQYKKCFHRKWVFLQKICPKLSTVKQWTVFELFTFLWSCSWETIVWVMWKWVTMLRNSKCWHMQKCFWTIQFAFVTVDLLNNKEDALKVVLNLLAQKYFIYLWTIFKIF